MMLPFISSILVVIFGAYVGFYLDETSRINHPAFYFVLGGYTVGIAIVIYTIMI